MSEIVNQSLQKIAKGTGIIFIGTIIGMLLGFIGRVLVAIFLS
jgi:O-antigen/teichoic acid export membrane protein